MNVGIIGYGRFGRLAADWIGRETKVVVFDPAARHVPGARNNVRWGPLEEAASCSIVVIAVPVSALKGVLRDLRSHIAPTTLIMDVCAVKKEPLRWMQQLLPAYVEILGTHPLFGPDSVGESLRGHRIVLCPQKRRSGKWKGVARTLRARGLVVEVLDADEHDRMMAETVFLTQCVGRWVDAAGLGDRATGTVHYERLKGIVEVARNDSEQLFRDMWLYNPHARRVARRLGTAWDRLERTLQPERRKNLR